jgi:hypothetical protein
VTGRRSPTALRTLRMNSLLPVLVSRSILLARGANATRNVPDSWLEAVEYCVELGADVNAKDAYNYTARTAPRIVAITRW